MASYCCLEMLPEQRFCTEASSLWILIKSLSLHRMLILESSYIMWRATPKGFYLMRQWPQYSVWHIGVKVQGWKYKVSWNFVSSLGVSQVKANPTTSILLVGVKSISVPWTFHTRGARKRVPKFWTGTYKLVEIEAKKAVFECSLDMKLMWLMHTRVVFISFKLGCT